jgi:hypothetical protein
MSQFPSVPKVVDDIGIVVSRMRPIGISYGEGMVEYMASIDNPSTTFDETFDYTYQNANMLLMPFYMFGHRIEIAKRLLDKDKDKVFKNQKYPLIALRMDIQESVSKGVWSYTLNLLIANYTDKKWNAEERMENIFKPVLYPIYERFMRELQFSGLFFWPGNQDFPEHTKVDRPFWGTDNQEGNVKNIFNDPIDAIEIIGLKLNSRSKNLNC